jgi:hypothetical protein
MINLSQNNNIDTINVERINKDIFNTPIPVSTPSYERWYDGKTASGGTYQGVEGTYVGPSADGKIANYTWHYFVEWLDDTGTLKDSNHW